MYLRGLQIVPGSKSPDGELIGQTDPRVGGVSYGAKHVRPDMSNLGFWMEACHQAGISGDDPHMKRAMLFVSRCQNRSESNPQPWARLGADDGGFVYAPAIRGKLNVGESKAGSQGRGLRSYGSMTYTGFKSLLYADVDHEDPRVRAAFLWIRKHWRLDSNPNMPSINSQEGLYYYYYVFAKAMGAWGRDVIVDLQGDRHNWRHELIDALAERVHSDGSWRGDNRWYEKFPILATSYSVLALQEALAR